MLVPMTSLSFNHRSCKQWPRTVFFLQLPCQIPHVHITSQHAYTCMAGRHQCKWEHQWYMYSWSITHNVRVSTSDLNMYGQPSLLSMCWLQQRSRADCTNNNISINIFDHKVVNLLAQIRGQHTIALACAASRGVCCSNAAQNHPGWFGKPPKSVSSRQSDERPTNARPGGTPSGQAHVGLFLGR